MPVPVGPGLGERQGMAVSAVLRGGERKRGGGREGVGRERVPRSVLRTAPSQRALSPVLQMKPGGITLARSTAVRESPSQTCWFQDQTHPLAPLRHSFWLWGQGPNYTLSSALIDLVPSALRESSWLTCDASSWGELGTAVQDAPSYWGPEAGAERRPTKAEDQGAPGGDDRRKNPGGWAWAHPGQLSTHGPAEGPESPAFITSSPLPLTPAEARGFLWGEAVRSALLSRDLGGKSRGCRRSWLPICPSCSSAVWPWVRFSASPKLWPFHLA